MLRPFSAFGVAAVVALAVGFAGTSADAESVMKQCGDQWKAAKAAGTTNGQTWPQFLSQCRAQLKAGAAAPSTAAAPAPPPTTTAPPRTQAAAPAPESTALSLRSGANIFIDRRDRSREGVAVAESRFEAVRTGRSTDFVGREHEAACCWSGGTSRKTAKQWLLLSGEPGIGKSRASSASCAGARRCFGASRGKSCASTARPIT